MTMTTGTAQEGDAMRRARMNQVAHYQLHIHSEFYERFRLIPPFTQLHAPIDALRQCEWEGGGQKMQVYKTGAI